MVYHEKTTAENSTRNKKGCSVNSEKDFERKVNE